MARAKRRLDAIAMALSIAAHAVVLTALALHAPRLVIPREQAGPPEPIIPILIMPRTPPAPPGATQKPEPIRLHRRQLRHAPPEPTVEPFIAPKEAPTPPPQAARPPAQPRVTVQPSPNAQLSTVLRGSAVGCAHPELLSPAERDRCLEKFGRGARDAPYLPAISPEKQAEFDRASQTRQRRREGGVPTGVAAPSSDSGASYRNKPADSAPSPPMRP
jgi:hypothetical protein